MSNLAVSIAHMESLSKNSGSNWFTKDTKKFWGTKVLTEPNHYGLFITSEDNFNATEKLFSVRFFNFNVPNEVETITFQKHYTLGGAKQFVRELTRAFDSLDSYREKTILDDIRSITVEQDEPLVLKIESNDGEYFKCNAENNDRFICG